MLYTLYALHDAHNGFGVPVAQSNDATAMRDFGNEVKKENSIWHSYPADFSLWKIGTYESTTGIIETFAPEIVCRGTDF